MPINDAILPDRTIRSTSSARIGQLEGVGIARDHAVDQIDLLGDGPGGVGVLAGDIDRPELGLEPSLAQPGDVGLSGIEPPARGRISKVQSHPRIRSRQGRSLWPSKSIPAAWTCRARSEIGGSGASLSSGPAPAGVTGNRRQNAGRADSEHGGAATDGDSWSNSSSSECPSVPARLPDSMKSYSGCDLWPAAMARRPRIRWPRAAAPRKLAAEVRSSPSPTINPRLAPMRLRTEFVAILWTCAGLSLVLTIISPRPAVCCRPAAGGRRQTCRGRAYRRLHRGRRRRPRRQPVLLARKDRDQGHTRRQGVDLGRDRRAQRTQDPGRWHALDLRRQPPRSSCTWTPTARSSSRPRSSRTERPLRGPNDLTLDPGSGGVYFTDPAQSDENQR